MKISEVKRIIESLERLSRNLENLRALSTGVMASLPDKDKAREWSKKNSGYGFCRFFTP